MARQFEETTTTASGDALYRATAPDYGAAFSVSLYVRIDSLDTVSANPAILFIGQAGTNDRDYLYYNRASGRILFDSFKVSGSLQNLVTGPILTLGQWYHIYLERNSLTEIKMYVDGVMYTADNAHSMSGRGAADSIRIGVYDSAGNSPGRVTVDFLRIWTTVIGPIPASRERYSTTPVVTANLWAAYALNSSGTYYNDTSGNSRHLTAQGSPTYVTEPDTICRITLTLIESTHQLWDVRAFRLWERAAEPIRARGLIRVGIDFDGDRWVNWSVNQPPNLIPQPLHFTMLPGGATGGELIDRVEQNPHGLFVRRLVGSPADVVNARLGANDEAFDVLYPGRTYSFVLWAKNHIGGSVVGHLSILNSAGDTEIASSSDVTLGQKWVKMICTFTAPVDGTAIQLLFVLQDGYAEDYDIDLTGWGVYEGSSPPDFNVADNDDDLLKPYEDITPYVLSVAADSGSAADITAMTPLEGRIEIVLNNENREWTPRNTDSPFYGRLKPLSVIEVQISRDGENWEPMWTGFYDQIAITPGTASNRQAVITGVQGLFYLEDARVTFVPSANHIATEILEDLVEGQPIPADRYTWRLGFGLLGVTTYLASSEAYTDFDDTEYIYPVAGAGLNDKASVRSFLNDLTINEGGFSFFTRGGRLALRRRDRLFPNVYET